MERILTKTLIVRLSSVGDIVLSSLLIRTLHSRFPQCQIEYLVKEEYADLVRYNPHVAKTIIFPSHGSLADLCRLRGSVRRSGYDLLIDIHDSLRSRVLCLGARRVVRIRKRKIARFALVHFRWDLYRHFGGSPNVALRYCEPLEVLGVSDDGAGLDLYVPEEAQKRARHVLQAHGIVEGQPVLGVCPSARHATKMWLPERFAEAAYRLGASHAMTVVLFGDTGERARCEAIAEEMHRHSPGIPVAVLAGKLSLLETAAAMDACTLVVTNDSGLMHIAAARKRKVVAVFGSTVRQFGFMPFGTESRIAENADLPCRPCTHIGRDQCPRGHFRCMNDVTVHQLVSQADALLFSKGSRV
jgi:lipopolysaccharide heptosyltransferase II